MSLANCVPNKLLVTLNLAVWNHYAHEMTVALSSNQGGLRSWLEDRAEQAYQLLRVNNPPLDVVIDLHEEAVEKSRNPLEAEIEALYTSWDLEKYRRPEFAESEWQRLNERVNQWCLVNGYSPDEGWETLRRKLDLRVR